MSTDNYMQAQVSRLVVEGDLEKAGQIARNQIAMHHARYSNWLEIERDIAFNQMQSKMPEHHCPGCDEDIFAD